MIKIFKIKRDLAKTKAISLNENSANMRVTMVIKCRRRRMMIMESKIMTTKIMVKRIPNILNLTAKNTVTSNLSPNFLMRSRWLNPSINKISKASKNM